MPDPNPDNLEFPSEAFRLRAQADGEAPPDLASADEAGSVAFERDLRSAVGRVMNTPAPVGVRDRVRRAIGSGPAFSARERLRLVRAEEHPGVYRAPLPLAKQWWLAAAAAVVLVVGMVWYMSGSPRGGPMRQRSSGPAPQAVPASLLVRAVAWVEGQHEGCAEFGPLFEQKMTVRTQAEAVATAVELLNKIPTVLDLKSEALRGAGYRFAGLGPCSVPGKGRSVHLLYKPDESAATGVPVVSLFVQEDTGEIDVEPGAVLVRRPVAGSDSKLHLLIWREGGLVYYLVSGSGMADEARAAFAVPERETPMF